MTHDAKVKLYCEVSSVVAVVVLVQSPNSVVKVLLVFVMMESIKICFLATEFLCVVNTLNNPQEKSREKK